MLEKIKGDFDEQLGTTIEEGYRTENNARIVTYARGFPDKDATFTVKWIKKNENKVTLYRGNLEDCKEKCRELAEMILEPPKEYPDEIEL